jgi:hypothetical protein
MEHVSQARDLASIVVAANDADVPGEGGKAETCAGCGLEPLQHTLHSLDIERRRRNCPGPLARPVWQGPSVRVQQSASERQFDAGVFMVVHIDTSAISSAFT